MDIKNGLRGVVGRLEANAEATSKKEGDYIGEDGLLYCGTCHTRKQGVYKMPWGDIRPYILCKCEAEAKERENAEEKRERFEAFVSENRRKCFESGCMAEWTFNKDDMSNIKVYTAMHNYVDNFEKCKSEGRGLLLYGTTGTGKTFAACEVANALLDKGYTVMFTNVTRLANIIQGMWEGKQEYIERLNDYHLLILDDIGAERKSEFMQELVYTIVNNRYNSGRPMIITTNLTGEEMKTPKDITLGRIYDRIVERCFPILITGDSHRRANAKADYGDMKDLLGL